MDSEKLLLENATRFFFALHSAIDWHQGSTLLMPKNKGDLVDITVSLIVRRKRWKEQKERKERS